MKQIQVLLVEPGASPHPVNVTNTPEGFAEMLNGPVEFGCCLPQRVMLVCREDSGELPLNRLDPSARVMIRGPFLLCGFAGSDFISLTAEQRQTFQKHFAVTDNIQQIAENMVSSSR